MKTINDDLIKLTQIGRFDVIVHGCNCFCAMGAGIAQKVKENFPEAFEADLKTTEGDKNKLGKFSSARIKRGGKIFTIVNAYTQYHYSGSGTLVDYNALNSVFEQIKKEFTGLKIAYPKIGAGLAKGNWEKISEIINEALEGEDHTLVVYNKP